MLITNGITCRSFINFNREIRAQLQLEIACLADKGVVQKQCDGALGWERVWSRGSK
jgi:hypothetical protein